jgi:tetratricopeptide (TPR) repeat protein
MSRVKYTEWIDSYVEGDMDETSRKKFEAELASNRDLSLEYQLEMDIANALKDDEIVDFRSKCIEAQNEVNLSERKLVRIVHLTRKYWYAAAAVLLVALIVGGTLLVNPGNYTSDKLFKMYYKSGETLGISRSGNVDMAEALRYFSKSDYQTAAGLFDKILVNDPNNFAVRYYSGISNIELKNYSQAILMFESIIKDGNNLYTENADWYLGLSYLASGQVTQAEKVFNGIVSTPDHYYYKDAKSILDKIGKGEKNKKFLNNLLFLILPF